MTVVASVSVVINVILLTAFFFRRESRNYFAGITEGDQPLVPRQRTRPDFRRYVAIRDEDVSGVSGEGTVGEVVQFSDGHAAFHWTGSKYPWTTPCPEGLDAILEIHGHGGKTRLVPIDES